MPDTPKWRRSLEPILSIGSYPGEPEIRRGGRRVLIVATIIANFFSMPQVFGDLDAGYTWVAGFLHYRRPGATYPGRDLVPAPLFHNARHPDVRRDLRDPTH